MLNKKKTVLTIFRLQQYLGIYLKRIFINFASVRIHIEFGRNEIYKKNTKSKGHREFFLA